MITRVNEYDLKHCMDFQRISKNIILTLNKLMPATTKLIFSKALLANLYFFFILMNWCVYFISELCIPTNLIYYFSSLKLLAH